MFEINKSGYTNFQARLDNLKPADLLKPEVAFLLKSKVERTEDPEELERIIESIDAKVADLTPEPDQASLEVLQQKIRRGFLAEARQRIELLRFHQASRKVLEWEKSGVAPSEIMKRLAEEKLDRSSALWVFRESIEGAKKLDNSGNYLTVLWNKALQKGSEQLIVPETAQALEKGGQKRLYFNPGHLRLLFKTAPELIDESDLFAENPDEARDTSPHYLPTIDNLVKKIENNPELIEALLVTLKSEVNNYRVTLRQNAGILTGLNMSEEAYQEKLAKINAIENEEEREKEEKKFQVLVQTRKTLLTRQYSDFGARLQLFTKQAEHIDEFLDKVPQIGEKLRNDKKISQAYDGLEFALQDLLEEVNGIFELNTAAAKSEGARIERVIPFLPDFFERIKAVQEKRSPMERAARRTKDRRAA